MKKLREEYKKILELREKKRIKYANGWTPELIERAKIIKDRDWEVWQEMDNIFQKDCVDSSFFVEIEKD